MAKIGKQFKFDYSFVKPIIRNNNIASERLHITVKAIGYARPSFLNRGEFIYSAVIEQVLYDVMNILPVIKFFDHMEEIENEAMKLVPSLFENINVVDNELEEKLKGIIETILSVKEHNIYRLPEPLPIRVNDNFLYEVHGLIASPKKELYLMDISGFPAKLDVKDAHAAVIINAVSERIESIFKNMKKQIA